MKKSLMAIGFATMLVAPSLAHADCGGRRLAGTAIGGVTGGLIGSAVSHGAVGGVLVGAGLGAFAGHQIAGSGCHHYAYYRGHRRYYRHARYDPYQRGAYSGGEASVDPARCEVQDQAFYDEHGDLIHRPIQVCR